MDDLKGGGDFPVESSRYMFEHSGIMEDGPVPVFTWYLLLCEVGAGHLGESAPGTFNKTIFALSFGGGCNDLVFVAVDTLEVLAPHEFTRSWHGSGRGECQRPCGIEREIL